MSIVRFGAALAAVMTLGSVAHAEETPARQSLDDAWWTGPMLASGAGALPKGRWLVEPYLFDVRSDGGDTLGNLTYVLYGVTDKTTVGVIPTFYFNRPDGAPNSSGVQVGDLTLQGQRQVTQFKPGGWVPTSSIVAQLILPTGKFDRLDGRAADGVGGGAYATSLGYNMQTYAWLPNGRIARFRLNTSGMVSQKAKVRDDSVYGTAAGFRGHARPGAQLVVNGAVEYSVTSNWVLALDLVYTHSEPTKVTGVDGAGRLVRFDTGTHDGFAVAPAVEYNFSPTVGALFGLRVIPAINGRKGSMTPAVALNMVY
jgi:hypothetical protein